MKLTKEELECFRLFSICADTSEEHTDKHLLRSIPGGKDIGLVQYSKKCLLFKSFPNKENEDIDFIGETDKIFRMVTSCQKDSVITITKEKVSFGKGSSYTFETLPVSFIGYTPDVVQVLVAKKTEKDSFKISCLDRLRLVKGYVGSDDFDIYGFFNKKFVGTDRVHGTGIVDVESDCDQDLECYFPSIFYDIVSSCKLKEVTIYDYKDTNQFMFEVDGVAVFFPKMNVVKNILPNILVPEMRKFYEFNHKATVVKGDIDRAISRIKIITSDALDNRLTLKFNADEIVLENKRGEYGCEEIPATVDKELVGLEVVVSANYLQTMVNSLGETVHIKADRRPNLGVITMTDQDNNKLFLHNLYKNID